MKLPCHLVRDLLPLYHDKLCAPDTAKDVEEHLSGCEACRAALDALDTTNDLPVPDAGDLQRAQALQMLQRKLVRSRVLTAVISALAVVLVLFAGAYFTRTYFSTRYIDADPSALHVSREENTLYLTADPGVKANCMSATVCEYNGETVVLFSVYSSIWDSWFGSSLPSDGLDLVRNGEVEAAYCVPYEAYRTLSDFSGIGTEFAIADNQGPSSLLADAVLMWQNN